ncbi:MAG: hypothetical protein ABI696_19095 [Rubrivivax sp.]
MPFDASFVHHLGKVAKLEKSFQQKAGLKALESEKLSQKVKGGYCFGACATWLTLALTREMPLAVDHASSNQVRRMAKGAVKAVKTRKEKGGDMKASRGGERVAA